MRQSLGLSWNRNMLSRDRSIESYFLAMGTFLLLVLNNSRLNNFGSRMIVVVAMVDCISIVIFLKSKLGSWISSFRRLSNADRFLFFNKLLFRSQSFRFFPDKFNFGLVDSILFKLFENVQS